MVNMIVIKRVEKEEQSEGANKPIGTLLSKEREVKTEKNKIKEKKSSLWPSVSKNFAVINYNHFVEIIPNPWWKIDFNFAGTRTG